MTRWFLVLTASISRGISLFNSSDMDLQQTLPVENTSCSYHDHEEGTVERKKRPPPLDLSSPVLAGAEVIVEPRVPLKCVSQRDTCHLSENHHNTGEGDDCVKNELSINVRRKLDAKVGSELGLVIGSEPGGDMGRQLDGNMGRQLDGNMGRQLVSSTVKKDNGNGLTTKLESNNNVTHSAVLYHPTNKGPQQRSSLQNRSPSSQGPESIREAAVYQKPVAKSIHVSFTIDSDT